MTPVRALLAMMMSGLIGCIPVLESSDTGLESCDTWTAPENAWTKWSTNKPPCLESEGYNQGQIVPDLRFVDQFGDEVALWQFYGQVIVLDFSTMWCGPCAELARGVDHTWKKHRDEGFMYITVLTQDLVSDPPDNDELNIWADDYSITAPVLSDERGYSTEIIPNNAYPQVMLIDRTMRVSIEAITPPEDAAVDAAVQAAL
ncbi:MAG: TlpA disulfide reductase family protein [Myxococcota bacterium]